jgi:predicted nuclease of predicted toxin-antitoxin system
MPAQELRFMVDVGVGRKVERWLREAGCDVAAVREIDPRAGDSDILKLSVEDSRIVLTMDKDFGELVYRSGKAHADKLKGSFCVYQNNTLRVSHQPTLP